MSNSEIAKMNRLVSIDNLILRGLVFSSSAAALLIALSPNTAIKGYGNLLESVLVPGGFLVGFHIRNRHETQARDLEDAPRP